MKFLLLALLSLTFLSCASHEQRKPSSVEDEVSPEANAARYYGNPR